MGDHDGCRMNLRPYQTALIDAARAHLMAGRRRVLIQAPTGAGKTALTAYMLGQSAARGRRSWFIVHRRELILQSHRAFRAAGIKAGIVGAGFPTDRRALVQIAGIQTLARRHRTMYEPDIIVWDEAHHIAAAQWSQIHKAYDCHHIGLSATPTRLDGTGLGEWFDEIVQGPSVADLIADGWLSPFRLFAPSRPDLSGVRSRAGDYARDGLQEAVDKPSITGDAVSHYRRLADGRRAVAFAVSVEHSRHIAAAFAASGIRAAHVDGATPAAERDETMRSFSEGRVRVLCNVDLFGEGVDVPGIECAILLRPTQSLSLYLQQVGRALRPAPGKAEAIILDHAGNALRHGLPDEPRQWSLEGERKSRRQRDAEDTPVKHCPACFRVVPTATRACPCGHDFAPTIRDVKVVDGVLQEMHHSALRRDRAREQGKAQTLDDLIRLGVMRGYKNPAAWARYVYNARRRT